MSLPDEMLINIFLDLHELDVLSCRFVCKTWKRVASDKSLIYYFRHQDIPLAERIIDSCEQNNIVSFTIGVAVYCTFDTNIIRRDAGTHELWVRCMIAAAKGGAVQILRKVISYGPTYGFKDAVVAALEHNHPECANIIRAENRTVHVSSIVPI